MDSNTNGLVKSYKFAVFSEIATSFVHEMKNPISAITLGMEFFDMSLNEQDPQRTTLRNIYKSSEKLNYLLDNLLLYYQNGSSQASPVKLSQVAEQSLSLTNYYTNRNQIKVELTVSEGEPWVNLKANQIMQALVYLTIWSVKRMPGGGTITFGFRPVENGVELFMRDQGPVLNPQQRNRLPELAMSGDDTGLGISLLLMAENGASVVLGDGETDSNLLTARFTT
jgi:signal transduction histidine kinase